MPDSYGESLRNAVIMSSDDVRVLFTDWVDSKTFEHYLLSADMAVQLRTDSRGESSGTVLDCMARGIPTICNLCIESNGRSIEDLDK